MTADTFDMLTQALERRNMYLYEMSDQRDGSAVATIKHRFVDRTRVFIGSARDGREAIARAILNGIDQHTALWLEQYGAAEEAAGIRARMLLYLRDGKTACVALSSPLTPVEEWLYEVESHGYIGRENYDMVERTPSEQQTWIRIRLLVAAYAYEFENSPIMDDAAFDDLCKQVDLDIATSRPDMDAWFRLNFTTYTGSWVNSLPKRELDRAANIYYRYHAPKELLAKRLKETLATEKKAGRAGRYVAHNVDLIKQVLIFDF